MKLFSFNKRSEERHPVTWESILYVDLSDKVYRINVTVANISTQGALLLSDTIYVNNHPLISNHVKNELTLSIQVKDINFQPPVSIRWYQWSVRKNRYEIGIKFLSSYSDHRKEIDALIYYASKGVD